MLSCAVEGGGLICLPAAYWYWAFLSLAKPGKSAGYCLPTSSTGKAEMRVNSTSGEKGGPSKSRRELAQAAGIWKGGDPTAHRHPFHTQPAPFFQWGWQGLNWCLSTAVLYLALGTMQSRYHHHQPCLRPTRPSGRTYLTPESCTCTWC